MDFPVTAELLMVFGIIIQISGIILIAVHANWGWYFQGLGLLSYTLVLPNSIIILPFIAAGLCVAVGIFKQLAPKNEQ